MNGLPLFQSLRLAPTKDAKPGRRQSWLRLLANLLDHATAKRLLKQIGPAQRNSWARTGRPIVGRWPRSGRTDLPGPLARPRLSG
jgi:hypothetical protein